MPYDQNGQPFDYSEPPSLEQTTQEVREMRFAVGIVVSLLIALAGFVVAGVWIWRAM